LIGSNNNELGAAKFMASEEFDCPTGLVAKSRAAAGVKAYRYRYYAGQDDSYVPSQSAPLRGLLNYAMHAGEIPFVFNTIGELGLVSTTLRLKRTPQNVAVANEFGRVWGAFAKDPMNGATKMGWPEYNPSGTLT
jgi:carboxylesterase type B